MKIMVSLKTRLAAFAGKGRLNALLVKLAWSQLFWILLITGIVRFYYYSILLTTTDVDTASYVNYHANIFTGQTEALRTPVYPYFIKAVALFGHKNLFDHVVIAQCLISFLSLILFYLSAQIIFKNRVIVFIASLFYGLMLPLISFDKMILTESLSVTCSVVLTWLAVSYIKKPNHIKAWSVALAVFLAILLRPSFIYLLPLAAIFWIIRLIVIKTDRKINLSGLAGLAIVILLISGYSHLNKVNWGYSGISVVSNHNEIAVIVEANIYHYGDDAAISADIDSNFRLVRKNKGRPVIGINIMKKYDPDRMHRFIFNCIKNRPGDYARHIFSKMGEIAKSNIFLNYAGHQFNTRAFWFEHVERFVFQCSFSMVYAFLAVSLILIVVIWTRNKAVPLPEVILWSLAIGQIAVALLGGYNEYQRLILPALPALVLLFWVWVDKSVTLVQTISKGSTTSLAKK